MWIFTDFGAFSVVQHRDDSKLMLVRCRCRADMEAFRNRLANKSDRESPLVEDFSADYRWRMILPRKTVVKVMSDAVGNIDYTNYKQSVVRTQGLGRARLYMQVYEILLNFFK